MKKPTRGTLADNEPHPAAYEAKDWIASLPPVELLQWREAFASCSISGNRLAEICGETLGRLMSGQPVSDRYVLGLAWAMGDAFDRKSSKKIRQKRKG